MIAEELMTQNPATVRSSARLRDAVQLLQNLEIRHLPVVDEEGALVGMLSDRDLRALELPYFVGGEFAGVMKTGLDASVTTVMSSDVLAVDKEADVADIIELMLEHRVGAVPVVDGDGALVGIVSYMDVLREVEEEMSDGE